VRIQRTYNSARSSRERAHTNLNITTTYYSAAFRLIPTDWNADSKEAGPELRLAASGLAGISSERANNIHIQSSLLKTTIECIELHPQSAPRFAIRRLLFGCRRLWLTRRRCKSNPKDTAVARFLLRTYHHEQRVGSQPPSQSPELGRFQQQ